MKRCMLVAVLMLAVVGLWSENWSPQPVGKAEFPVGPQIYIINIEGAIDDSITSIALPAQNLPPGQYHSIFELQGSPTGPGSGGVYERISGPNKYISADFGQIQPRYINGTYGQAALANPPRYYDFKVHFCVRSGDNTIIQFSESPLTSSTVISKSVDITSHRDDGKLYHEFDLDPFCYVRINTNIIGSNSDMTVYYALDTEAPPAPSDVSILKSDDTTVNPDEQGIFFVSGSSFKVRWRPSKDNGSEVCQGHSLESISDTAGYYIWKDGVTSSEKNPIEVVNDSPLEDADGNINWINYAVTGLSEGTHTIVLSAYDKAGNGTVDEGVGSFSTACTVLIDRKAPDFDHTKVGLQNYIEVTGKGKYADNNFPVSLKWDSGTDALSKVKEYEVYLNGSLSQTISAPTTTANLGDLANGTYEVKVLAVDNADNASTWTEAGYQFRIDKSAPAAPGADTVTLNGAADGLSVDTGTNTAAYATTESTVRIGFARAQDGTTAQTWQSGLGDSAAAYVITKRKDGDTYTAAGEVGNVVVGETRVTMDVNMEDVALNGELRLRVQPFDLIGNPKDDSAANFLYISLRKERLSSVTFADEPYEYTDDGSYRLVWNAPEFIPTGAHITGYVVSLYEGGGGAPFLEDQPTTDVHTYLEIPDAALGQKVVAKVVATDSKGNTSTEYSKTFTLPSGPPVEEEKLEEDTTWSGPMVMDTTKIVPSGITLTIEMGTSIQTVGNVALIVESGGHLKINGEYGSEVTFVSDHPTLYNTWRGILISGEAEIRYLDISNAGRGIAALEDSDVTIENSAMTHNRVGLHIYNALPTVTDSRFEGSLWYGVKEDAIPAGTVRPVMTGCVFKGNNISYYHDTRRDIDMGTLNDIGSNHDNTEE